MKLFAAIVCAFALLLPARAQINSLVSARSRSGQFVVYANQLLPFDFHPPAMATNTSLVFLEPALLAVSAERIKESLYRELGASAAWSGKIYLDLHTARTTDEPVTIFSEKFMKGWNYRVQLPDALDRYNFVRAVAGALLLEMANRNAGGKSAEIPAWLVEGFSQELFASDEIELILPPPRMNVNGITITPPIMVSARRTNSLERIAEKLHERPPLTLDEFVHQLLRLKDGPDCLRATLNALPDHFNWQLAFLRGFDSHFKSVLDVEKWWALQLVEYGGRDLANSWPFEESKKRLDEVVLLPVQVRTGINELPLRAEISLQIVVRDWEPLRQTPILRQKLRDLESLRMRASMELIPLVDDYRGVISNFLDKRDNSDFISPAKIKLKPSSKYIIEETVRRLDELDAQRLALQKTETNSVAAGTTDPVPDAAH
jgi:hypothetical protein